MNSELTPCVQSLRVLAIFGALLGFAFVTSAQSRPVTTPPAIIENGPNPWSLDIESTYSFTTIPNPFFALAGQYNKNPLDYQLASQILAARYQLTEDGGPGLLRGNVQASGGLIYSAILRGPETFYAGALFGFRYNFSPRNSAWSPYLEVRGGIGWTDCRGFRYAQQQDLCFTYLLGLGLSRKLSPLLSISAGAIDQHISNAYLTNPNYGFDSVGFTASMEIHF